MQDVHRLYVAVRDIETEDLIHDFYVDVAAGLTKSRDILNCIIKAIELTWGYDIRIIGRIDGVKIVDFYSEHI